MKKLFPREKKTTVVNKRNSEYDVYIGRGSIFGNMYEIGVYGTRKECIAKYRSWFYAALDCPEFKEEIEKLKGLRLGCYCKPLACHGDIIVEYLERR